MRPVCRRWCCSCISATNLLRLWARWANLNLERKQNSKSCKSFFFYSSQWRIFTCPPSSSPCLPPAAPLRLAGLQGKLCPSQAGWIWSGHPAGGVGSGGWRYNQHFYITASQLVFTSTLFLQWSFQLHFTLFFFCSHGCRQSQFLQGVNWIRCMNIYIYIYF